MFNPCASFIIVYIDDVLAFSNTINQHFRHLQTFINVVKRNGLAISASKLILFQTKIRFLGYNIYQSIIGPSMRSLAFIDKFPDETKDKNQLQRCLERLNYISNFFPICDNCAHLYTKDLERVQSPRLRNILKQSNKSKKESSLFYIQ